MMTMQRYYLPFPGIECVKHSMPLRFLRRTSLTPKQLAQIHAHFIKSPQPHILNPLLKSFTNSTTPHHALCLYNQMLQHPFAYNHYTFTYAIKVCSFLLADHKGQEIHGHVLKTGHFQDVFVQNSLVHFYLVHKDVVSANWVFESIDFPDVVSWTSMISGLAKCGHEKDAIFKFLSMDVEPNCNTLVSVVSACCNLRAFRFGKVVHGYVFRNFNKNNIILDNALLEFYIKCEVLDRAKYLFVEMPEKDVFSWTSIIGGYASLGLSKEAISLFQEMLKLGNAKPNEATIVNVLSACSSSCALGFGQWVYGYVRSLPDFELNGHLGNALINMFVKCGDMGMAVRVFSSLSCKDVISWSTIISGLAMNGYGKQAMKFFSLMLVHGVPPDELTFVGVLSACSHIGLIHHGVMLYKAMYAVYGIVPQMQHYTCMVDMYGRAGLLEEAEAFIREMPVKEDGQIWGALLSACRMHGSEEMFERIKKALIRARGMKIGTSALLLKTCDVENDGEGMQIQYKGMKRFCASSWIEISPSCNIHNTELSSALV